MHGPLPSARCGAPGHADSALPWRVFQAFHRLMRSQHQLMTKTMSGHDIHPAQALCLRELAHNDGISQSDLADRLNVTRPTVTVMVQKMEQAGLLERRVDEADQRFTRIYLTEDGKRVHVETRRRIEEVLTRTIEPLPEKDQLELERLLDALASSVEAALAEGDPS